MLVSKSQSDSHPVATIDALLGHVARYRITVVEALRTLPELSRMRPRRIHDLLRRCRREGRIDSAPLHQGARYWHLAPAGAQRCGLDESRSGPLREAAKLRAYAMLRFCCLSKQFRYRLTAEELQQNFPTLYRPGLPCGYYFDPTGDGQVGLLRVDTSGRGRWDRTVQSLRHDIASHVLHAGFRQLVRVGRFQVTLVTVLPQKAARVREALDRFRDTRRVPVHVIAMPELLPLIAPSRGKEVQRKNHRSR